MNVDLKGYQKEKALLYISIRDAYERLYRNEAENRTEDSRQREYLNVSYDEFVMRYGNLNARQNAKLLMMDASGRDVLALERAEEGKFVKADIFERPVSFSVERTFSSVPFPFRWRHTSMPGRPKKPCPPRSTDMAA